ncbi:hypothetical protein L6452_32966 [Arctium lappa]|uniref:Uncharacterized protein n=1 Tax=Arctium lappa TaxID=4217 RepID=A0ACB8Z6P4_ARCLA|nr:hypothetical protein L6452_32966 [Arctium lappa]
MEAEDDDCSVEESYYGNDEEEGGSSVPSIWSEDREKSNGEWGIEDTWEEVKEEKKIEPQSQKSDKFSFHPIDGLQAGISTGFLIGKTKKKTVTGQGGKGSCCMGKKENLKFPNYDPMVAENSGGPINSWIEIINQEKGADGKETPSLDTLGNNKSIGPSDLRTTKDMFNANGKNKQMGLGQSIRVGPAIENGLVVNEAKSKNEGIGMLLGNPKPKVLLGFNGEKSKSKEKRVRANRKSVDENMEEELARNKAHIGRLKGKRGDDINLGGGKNNGVAKKSVTGSLGRRDSTNSAIQAALSNELGSKETVEGSEVFRSMLGMEWKRPKGDGQEAHQLNEDVSGNEIVGMSRSLPINQ